MHCLGDSPEQGSAQALLDQISLNADAQQIPLNGMIELTYRCNIDCVHWYCRHLTNTAGRQELSTDGRGTCLAREDPLLADIRG